MKPEHKNACRQAIWAVRDLWTAGNIDDNIYHKCMVGIAYEFVVDEEIDTGVAMLMEIPLSYYESVQPQQLVEDQEYAQICITIARHLALGGYLSNRFSNMGGARA